MVTSREKAENGSGRRPMSVGVIIPEVTIQESRDPEELAPARGPSALHLRAARRRRVASVHSSAVTRPDATAAHAGANGDLSDWRGHRSLFCFDHIPSNAYTYVCVRVCVWRVVAIQAG